MGDRLMAHGSHMTVKVPWKEIVDGWFITEGRIMPGQHHRVWKVR